MPNALPRPRRESSSAFMYPSNAVAPSSTLLATSVLSNWSMSAAAPASSTRRSRVSRRSRCGRLRSKSIVLPFISAQQRPCDPIELDFDTAAAETGDHGGLELRVANRAEFETFPFKQFQGELGDDSFAAHDRHPRHVDGEVFGPALGARVNRLIDKDSRRFACRLGGS